ncbi:MAG: hypothetical protein Q8P60_12740 [Pseudorhodobacter sp.]|nr:hypothetical protein [Pseudorhodobacter sp.]
MSDPIRTFRHFRDVPDALWRWSNFSPAEIACRGTGRSRSTRKRWTSLQGYFWVADGYFAADQTSFWGAKVG